MPPSYTRTNEVLLSIEGVSLSFGSNLVLRDVNAQVTDLERENHAATGQVICFLGPSGIGKTQLSRIIAGLQVPSGGKVVLQNGQPTRRGQVGMVPQHYPLFDYATVADNLRIAGKQAGLTTKESNEKASVYVDTLGLHDYLGMYPRALSGGTRQRVAIARQLMCSGHYLVMDEPFSGLDPIMKRAATKLITDIAHIHTHNTIIIVTHDVTEGMSVADTVWLMGLEHKDGAPQAGARLVEQFDLAAMGLAWRPDITHDKVFMNLVADIRDKFQTLR
jgi:NitT/TauT family transport system ATP-binding protein